MSDRAFFDSNILVYIFDQKEPAKASAALSLLRTASAQHTAVVSYQVIHEFLNVALKKSRPPLPRELIRSAMDNFFGVCEIVPCSTALIEHALELHYQVHFHWYDCLIVAAALEAKCNLLYTEDLQDGQRFGELVVSNPFGGGG